jgi:hypothetical protein
MGLYIAQGVMAQMVLGRGMPLLGYQSRQIVKDFSWPVSSLAHGVIGHPNRKNLPAKRAGTIRQ